jgi:glycosyltransferase involved in cell wall biosynthesis
VSPLKGGPHLLPIVERVARKRDDARFVVVGEVHIPGWRDALARHPCRDRVHLVGALPNAEVARLYAAADVFMLPSNSEGFPRVLLECMAAGLAFVAFDVGGVREIADDEHGRFIVPRGDVDAFAERVLELLDDPELRARLGEIGVKRVERFATPRVARLFVERIVEVSEKGR